MNSILNPEQVDELIFKAGWGSKPPMWVAAVVEIMESYPAELVLAAVADVVNNEPWPTPAMLEARLTPSTDDDYLVMRKFVSQALDGDGRLRQEGPDNTRGGFGDGRAILAQLTPRHQRLARAAGFREMAFASVNDFRWIIRDAAKAIKAQDHNAALEAAAELEGPGTAELT